MKTIVIAVILYFGALPLFGATYYVSSSTGSDSNSGTSEAAAWRTLKKLSGRTFNPGDIIKFKAGDTFSGHCWNITSSGTSSVSSGVITATRYGSGPDPILDGTGTPSSEYVLSKLLSSSERMISAVVNIAPDVSFWKFTYVDMRNADVGVHCYRPITLGGAQQYFYMDKCGLMNFAITGVGFYAESGSIRDITIRGAGITESTHGIFLKRCRNILIESMGIFNVGASGIKIIDNAENTGIIRNSQIYSCGKAYSKNGSCAVYLANVRDLVIDSCDIHHTIKAKNPNPTGDNDLYSSDGVAIDFESANRNITVSNCTLRDNDGAAILIYRNPTFGSENWPLFILDNTVYGNGRKGKQDGTPGGAQFIRHIQAQQSAPGTYGIPDAGVIAGNIITLSNNTVLNQERRTQNVLTSKFPDWYSVEDGDNTIITGP